MHRAHAAVAAPRGGGGRRARRATTCALLLLALVLLGLRASRGSWFPTRETSARDADDDAAPSRDPSPAADAAPWAGGSGARPAILLLGDSLVQRSFEPGGWGARLAAEYARTADVVLRGYSGYNSRWLRDLMTRRPELFPPPDRVALLVVLVGANDAARPEGHKSHYAVPAAEYEENLRWIVRRYRRSPSATSAPAIVVATPPPLDEDARMRMTTDAKGMPASRLDRSEARTREYSRIAARVGGEFGAGVADLGAAFEGRGKDWRAALLSDGLHFTPEGQALAHDAVAAATPSEARPDALAMDAPTHEALVGANNTNDWHGHLAEMGVA